MGPYEQRPKLTVVLATDSLDAKQRLKKQAGYFNIITPKYFSEALSPKWLNIAGKDKLGPNSMLMDVSWQTP